MRLDAHFDMLPERAFQKRGFGSAPATLEGGKGGGGGSSPDPQIGEAQKQMANLAEKEYNDFKTTIWPEMQKQYAAQTESATKLGNQQYALNEKNAAISDDYYNRMKSQFYPMQDKVIQDANEYNTEGNMERQAALAMGDVNTQYDNQRQQNNMRLQSYGINPTSGAYVGQNNAMDVMQAATGAAAATKARTAAEQLGWAKRMDAIGLGSGLAGNQATSTGLALSAGNSSLAAGQVPMSNLTSMNSANMGATSTATNAWNQVGQLGIGSMNAQANMAQAQATQSAGWGSALGSIGAVGLNYALKSSDIRMKENISVVGTAPNGLTIYEFEYKPEHKDSKYAGHGRFRGYMAHEVKVKFPDAILKDSKGYDVIDYAKVS